MTLETFLKKFRELRNNCPRLFSATRDSENCLYTEDLAYSKNCYYVFAGGWAEDSYYGELLVGAKNCVDCLKIEQCELCYECVDCVSCYNGNFLVNCMNTHDSQYSFWLRDCGYCFLSNNQSHKKFLFKNKQCTKEEYFALVNDYKKKHSTKELYAEFLALLKTTPRINLYIVNSENCLGNYISYSKNVYYGFDVVKGQDYLYSIESGYGRDCCDIYVTGEGELMYECVDVSKGCYNCSFCVSCVTCVNCEFCLIGYNLSDCFGCCYLKDKRYYILNTPYAPEEYKKEIAALKKSLREAGMYDFGLMTKALLR